MPVLRYAVLCEAMIGIFIRIKTRDYPDVRCIAPPHPQSCLNSYSGLDLSRVLIEIASETISGKRLPENDLTIFVVHSH